MHISFLDIENGYQSIHYCQASTCTTHCRLAAVVVVVVVEVVVPIDAYIILWFMKHNLS